MDDNSDYDMDTQMIFYSDPVANKDDNSFVNKLALNRKKLGKHPVFEFINRRNQSLYYSIFTLVIYNIKFIATVVIISVSPTNCEANVDVWLAIMSFHDFILIIARCLLLSCIIARRRKYAAALAADDQSDASSAVASYQVTIQQLNERLVANESENNPNKNFLNNYTKRQDAGNFMLSCTLALFLALFIWGQWIYFGPYPSCGQMPTVKKIVFLINIFFGYLYITLPLIFLAFGCISLAWLVLGSRCLQKFSRSKDKRVFPLSMSKGVSKHKYSSVMKIRSDCGICFYDFVNDDEIMKLRCDESHVFHERCLEKWLENNRSTCPICEKVIDRKSKRKEAIQVLSE